MALAACTCAPAISSPDPSQALPQPCPGSSPAPVECKFGACSSTNAINHLCILFCVLQGRGGQAVRLEPANPLGWQARQPVGGKRGQTCVLALSSAAAALRASSSSA